MIFFFCIRKCIFDLDLSHFDASVNRKTYKHQHLSPKRCRPPASCTSDLVLQRRAAHLHLLVYPGLEVADVAMDTDVVPCAAVPPNALPSQPPKPILQGHQRAAAFSLTTNPTIRAGGQLFSLKGYVLNSHIQEFPPSHLTGGGTGPSGTQHVPGHSASVLGGRVTRHAVHHGDLNLRLGQRSRPCEEAALSWYHCWMNGANLNPHLD